MGWLWYGLARSTVGSPPPLWDIEADMGTLRREVRTRVPQT
jgi:hypothetical protein